MLLPTLPQALRDHAAKHGAGPALWTRQGDGPYRPTTWRTLQDQAARFACGLRSLALPAGQPLAVLCGHRPEWPAVEAGAMAAGHPPAPCFPGWSPAQLAEVLRALAPAALVVEPALLPKALAASEGQQLPLLVLGPPVGGAQAWDALPAGDGWDRLVDALEPTAVAAITVTPGTARTPHLVRHTHAALAAHAQRFARATGLSADDTLLSRLPPALLLERAVVRAALWSGAQLHVAPEHCGFAAQVRDVRPSFLHGTPEDWESLRRVAEERLAAEPANRQKVLGWGQKAAQERHRLEDDYLPVPGPTLAAFKLAQKVVFEPLKLELGVHAARFLLCGLGPTRRETLEFFASVDLEVQEAWGLAEAGGPVSLNAHHSRRLGTQGRPLPGLAVRVPADGEIELRGDVTCLADDGPVGRAEGWLRTADVGDLDVDGFLRVQGRGEEQLNLRGRRRAPPQLVEARLCAAPLVAHAVAVADGRSPVALLSLDRKRSARFAREAGIPDDPAILASHPALLSTLERELDRVQREAPDTERVRRFAVVPGGFSLEEGELTPAGTVCRRRIVERRRELLDPLLLQERKPSQG